MTEVALEAGGAVEVRGVAGAVLEAGVPVEANLLETGGMASTALEQRSQDAAATAVDTEHTAVSALDAEAVCSSIGCSGTGSESSP